MAIDVKPLQDLLASLEEASNRLADVDDARDLFPYVRVLELVADDGTSPGEVVAAPGSNRLPDARISRDTGRRGRGNLGLCLQQFGWLPVTPDPREPPNKLAEALRAHDPLRQLSVERRAWWKSQLRIECDCLFNDDTADRILTETAQKAWGVVRCIAVSR